MKKSKKVFLQTGAFTFLSLVLSAAIQRLLFLLPNKKYKADDGLFYSWKDQDIFYKVIGTGSPVLLLHNTCIGASHKEWEKNIDALSRSHRIYIPDLPGYGSSSKVAKTYTAYEYAVFIHDFITDVIGQPTSIIASSVSGCLALKAYELHPQDVKKLALISPTGMEEIPFATSEESRTLALLQKPLLGTGMYLKECSKKAIKDRLQKEMFFSKELVTKELVQSYYQSAHLGYEKARFAYASAASRFIHASIQKTLETISIPLMVVWGEENICNPPHYLEKIQQLHPEGEYILFEKTRMLPHYENYSEFNKVIEQFIN
jgi:pimeloyl-ACP methyl ester carboxylesterase